MAENNNQYGGPPMVKINGKMVRQLREENGLTQLYVATVVGVTTDTISRWENGRYPSIKQENAQKLAETLQVSLEEILDSPDVTSPPESPPPKVEETEKQPAINPKPLFILFFLAVVFLIVLLVLQKKEPVTSEITIKAERILPPHAPAGKTFPVIIKVTSSLPEPLSIVLRETVPPGSRVYNSEPSVSTISKDHRLVKWITRVEHNKNFAYLANNPADSAKGAENTFSGQVLTGPDAGKAHEIFGDNSIQTRNFHWADTNMDSTIDDEEILAVYDLFSEVGGDFDFKGDQLDELWAAESYTYNPTSKRYEVQQ